MSEACLAAAKSALVGVANGDSLASAICAAMETAVAVPVARHLQDTVDLTALQETVDTLGTNLQGTMDGLNTLLLLYGGALVFLMHGGFAMVSLRQNPCLIGRRAARAHVALRPFDLDSRPAESSWNQCHCRRKHRVQPAS